MQPIAGQFQDSEGRRRRRCAYCGRPGPLTRDHVFARTLYGEAPVVQAVTVKACEACNQAKALTDNFMRDWAAIDARSHRHPVANANFFGPVTRAIDRNQSPVKDSVLAPPSRLVEFVTEAGIFVEQAYEIRLRGDRLRDWLWYVVRGLTYHHFRESLPPDYPHLTMHPEVAEFPATVETFTSHPEYHGTFSQGGDVVRWGYLGLGSGFAVWLIALYDRLGFTVAVLPEDQLAIMRQRAAELGRPAP
jgi:hypothetical protein